MRALGGAYAKMSGMKHWDTSFIRVVSARLQGALIALSLNGAVLAAGTRIERPNLKSRPGRPLVLPS